MRNLSAVELKTHLDACASGDTGDDAGPLLLDVRQPWEFNQYRIEGSLLIPMADVPARITELDPQRETVVICAHGIRSYHVSNFLEHSGFEKIINLKGGVAEWARDIDHRSDIK